MQMGDKDKEQAGLSRATLEISSEFSSNFMIHNPYSGCWNIPLLIFWGRLSLDVFFIKGFVQYSLVI